MLNYIERLNPNQIAEPLRRTNARRKIFFDIETTGLSWRSSHIYLIGLLYYENDGWIFRQWFLDHPFQEKELLLDFTAFLHEFAIRQNVSLVHFNGDTFDLPYVRHKCVFYGIPDPFAESESIDLCKTARKLKKITGMQSVRQKDVETYLQIPRRDTMSGKELIDVYYSYLKSNAEEELYLMKLHNHDDVLGLADLLVLLDIQSFLNGGFQVLNSDSESCEISVLVRTEFPLPSRFLGSLQEAISRSEYLNRTTRLDFAPDSAGISPAGFHAETFHFFLQPQHLELKHFFPDYKNYYYLPFEDQAIHKDVAVYVDADKRVKAGRENCYQRKTADFLPDPDNRIPPGFRMEAKEKWNWFIPDASWQQDPNAVHAYLCSLLRSLG